jgi:type VI secretion system protein ImpH
MASQKRESHAHLNDRLFEEFYRFSFYKAVNVLERLSPDKKPLGQTFSPGQEAVRFSVKPGLSFPASDIAALKKSDDGGPADMAVTFMGLIGPAGVLPYWYNELAGQRMLQKDFALTAFFDIFQHRLISLFYLAWKKYQFLPNYETDAKDRFSGYLLSLLGMGTKGLADSAGLPCESLIFCSGLLSRQTSSSDAIEAAVETYAENPARVQQFVERVVAIEPEDQTRLGVVNARLGIDAVCGRQTWESQSKFRVHLGPMSFRNFVRYLPSGDMLRSTFALVKSMVDIEHEFDISVSLKRDEVPACALGGNAAIAPRLGWSTWISAAEFKYQHDPLANFEESALQPAVRRKGEVQW